MPSVGQQLRQAREKSGVNIEQVARDTRIRAAYLEALESDDRSVLPGDFFYRSFVRQYASFLGLNPAQLEAELAPMVESSSTNTLMRVPQPATAPDPEIQRMRETLLNRPEDQQSAINRFGKTWTVIVALLILGSGGYFAWQQMQQAPPPAPVTIAEPTPRPDAPASPVTEPATTQTADNAATPVTEAVTTPPASPVAATPGPASSEPATATALTPAGAGVNRVTVTAKEDTWMRITADGKRVFGGTLPAGEARLLEASNALLWLGNAGTVEVTLNGKSIGAIGPRGQIRNVLVNPTGFEIKLPPPKPVAPPAPTPEAAPATPPAQQ
jgi:cytoskeleton protein RodZ